MTYCTITEVIGRRVAPTPPNTGQPVLELRTRYTGGGLQHKILMQIRVLFFGVLKDLVGRSSETLELPEGARLSLRARLAESVAPFQTPAGLEFPGVNLLATGRRP